MSDSKPEVRLLFSSPYPIWHVVSSPDGLTKPDVEIFQILMSLEGQGLLPKDVVCSDYRCVSIDRLPVIVNNGIDVFPTNSVIYVDFPDKAFEYGGWPKVLLVLNSKQLSPTWEEVEVTASAEKLEAIRKTHRTEILSEDGSKYWFSRLHEDDPKVTTAYERLYAKYIPGDAQSALIAAFVFAGSEWSPQSSHAL
ncbi:hypothetical protein AAKU67_004008 [Oxalobacteraceae bacterium GrIS 2.11]